MEKVELVSYFNESLFIPALRARTKEGVLEELVERFVEAKFLRNQTIALEMVHRREQLGSTGIGHGIAIPHAKSPLVQELMLVSGSSPTGVPFEALDGEPVRLFFLLIGPDSAAGLHVKALSRIARLVRRESVRETLLAAPDAATFHQVLIEAEER